MTVMRMPHVPALRHSDLFRHSSFEFRHLSQLPFAQDNNPNRRDQDQHTDDLEGHVVIREKQQPYVVNVVGLRRSQRRKSLFGHGQLSHHKTKLDEECDGDRNATGYRDVIDFAQVFRPQIQQHDDEEKEHHDGAGVDEDLDGPDEECIQRDEQRREAHETNDETERARDRAAVDDDGRAEYQHEKREEPKQKRRHQQNGVMEWWRVGVMKEWNLDRSQHSITPSLQR